MKKLNGFLLAFLTSLILSTCSSPKPPSADRALPKGTLFIIGGGERDSSLMVKLIKSSGWKPGDWISIASMASRWDSAYLSMNNEFRFYTNSNIKCIRIDSNTVKNPASLDSMRQSKIIYLNGGDQSVFMRHIKGTNFKKIINEAYAAGTTIAGTSAGAALMSERMLTGNQLKIKKYSSAIPVIWKDNVEVTEGLGFLDSVIIDQHFIVRSRANRLLSAILSNRSFDGIGIDESTAIIVHGDTATVAGESQVLVYKSPAHVFVDENLIGTDEIKLSVYLPGAKFKVKQ